MSGFVGLPSRVIGWGERLWNDLIHVKWNMPVPVVNVGCCQSVLPKHMWIIHDICKGTQPDFIRCIRKDALPVMFRSLSPRACSSRGHLCPDTVKLSIDILQSQTWPRQSVQPLSQVWTWVGEGWWLHVRNWRALSSVHISTSVITVEQQVH